MAEEKTISLPYKYQKDDGSYEYVRFQITVKAEATDEQIEVLHQNITGLFDLLGIDEYEPDKTTPVSMEEFTAHTGDDGEEF